MAAATAQTAFRYRPRDSATGVTRTSANLLAEVLGVDETQVIHLALHELATKVLPCDGHARWAVCPGWPALQKLVGCSAPHHGNAMERAEILRPA